MKSIVSYPVHTLVLESPYVPYIDAQSMVGTWTMSYIVVIPLVIGTREMTSSSSRLELRDSVLACNLNGKYLHNTHPMLVLGIGLVL